MRRKERKEKMNDGKLRFENLFEMRLDMWLVMWRASCGVWLDGVLFPQRRQEIT